MLEHFVEEIGFFARLHVGHVLNRLVVVVLGSKAATEKDVAGKGSADLDLDGFLRGKPPLRDGGGNGTAAALATTSQQAFSGGIFDQGCPSPPRKSSRNSPTGLWVRGSRWGEDVARGRTVSTVP